MPWTHNVTPKSEKRELDYFLMEIGTRVKFGTFTWNPDNCPTDCQLSDTLTAVLHPSLTGLRVGMGIKVIPPVPLPAGTTVEAAVDVDDALTVIVTNFTASAINMPAGDWSFFGVVI